MFPQGSGFVLVFDYMLSDLAEVVRNSKKPLTEVSTLSCPHSESALGIAMISFETVPFLVFVMYYIYVTSGPSLLTESTNSMIIIIIVGAFKATYRS